MRDEIRYLSENRGQKSENGNCFVSTLLLNFCHKKQVTIQLHSIFTHFGVSFLARRFTVLMQIYTLGERLRLYRVVVYAKINPSPYCRTYNSGNDQSITVLPCCSK